MILLSQIFNPIDDSTTSQTQILKWVLFFLYLTVTFSLLEGPWNIPDDLYVTLWKRDIKLIKYIGYVKLYGKNCQRIDDKPFRIIIVWMYIISVSVLDIL